MKPGGSVQHFRKGQSVVKFHFISVAERGSLALAPGATRCGTTVRSVGILLKFSFSSVLIDIIIIIIIISVQSTKVQHYICTLGI